MSGERDTARNASFSPRRKKALSIAALVIFAVLTLVLAIVVGRPMVRYAREPERFRAWVDTHGVYGRLAYMGMMLLQILVAIIPGEPLEILGGYAFGAVEGTILCTLAATAGSLAVFALVRFFGVKLVEVFFSREKLNNLRFLKSSPKRDLLFLVIFMIPGTPKDLLCYFAGLTDIRFPVWLLICSLGRIPSIVTSTVGGDALGTQSYLSAIIVFAATLAVSGGGILLYRAICKKHERRD